MIRCLSWHPLQVVISLDWQQGVHLLNKITEMAEDSYGKSFLEAESNPVTKYIWENSLREPDSLRQIRDETKKSLGRASIMLVDPIESQFLRFLIGACGAKR